MIEVRIYECEAFQPQREFAVVTVDGNGVLITAADPRSRSASRRSA